MTIVRDSAFGVPHIYGDTRPELMFGIGYASAQDRLFFIDALRHAGRAQLASFAGGGNAAMDASVWAGEPYTEADLSAQVQYIRTRLQDGQQIYSDIISYVAGLNAYIAAAKLNPLMLPAEYAALGDLAGPDPFRAEDLVSIATLVGGIFGVGGGRQLSNAELYQAMRARFGPEHRLVAGSPELPATASRRGRRGRRPRFAGPDRSGFASFRSFVDPADPEAPTTVRGRSFPYLALPRPSRAVTAAIALPDPGRSFRRGRSSPAGRLTPPTCAAPSLTFRRRSAALGCSPFPGGCRTRCSSRPVAAPPGTPSR